MASPPVLVRCNSVIEAVKTAKAHPKLLSSEFLPFLSLAQQEEEIQSPTTGPALSDAPTPSFQLNSASHTFTVVALALVSQSEAKHHWNGISDDSPELLYRSDLDSNPCPHPQPGDRWFQLPVKTAYGVSGTSLNKVWHEVAPLIIALFKQRGVSYPVLKSARFLIVDEGDQKILGPVVVWVALHPGRHTVSDARDVSPDVLRILAEHGVKLSGTKDFFATADAQFHDIARRSIGWVDRAPKIAIDVNSSGFSRDIGTFELDPSKFSANFKGNVVDLGNKIDLHELNRMFWPNDSNATGMKLPSNRQLRIRGVDGCGTDLTVGRYSELEAYLGSESGEESVEVVIYNYSKTSGSFSGKGDSGSLIFTGDGRMLAVLHSGMPRGLSNHVTYGTPAWWVVDMLKLR
ncbi:hypothetical protein K466DRAFT_612128 [Polyporus arcularius HHB13444]|uniref:Uncharacterized protein n=1 Tax=Polyporus arcularius HHB13444 TaxID=1314778 RepID=A0A5C3PI85_9APHY|nr:hypothetical protein K466DRAFT_612128 [Polyporus arcularius HHB13444]